MVRVRRPIPVVALVLGLAAGFAAGYGLSPRSATATQPDLPGLSARVAALEGHVNDLLTKVGCVQTVGQFDIMFVNCNVHIRNGLGATESSNGLGNLIIGYNELHPDTRQARTGSHNVIVGPRHDYTSYGGLVAGQENTITGQFATVTGGTDNVASGFAATVSGGFENVASGFATAVSGGFQNTAVADTSTVSGGEGLTATFTFQHLP